MSEGESGRITAGPHPNNGLIFALGGRRKSRLGGTYARKGKRALKYTCPPLKWRGMRGPQFVCGGGVRRAAWEGYPPLDRDQIVIGGAKAEFEGVFYLDEIVFFMELKEDIGLFFVFTPV